jgi:hypothetical protein
MPNCLPQLCIRRERILKDKINIPFLELVFIISPSPSISERGIFGAQRWRQRESGDEGR